MEAEYYMIQVGTRFNPLTIKMGNTSDTELEILMEQILSPCADFRTGTSWLEGFLGENGTLLVYNPALWTVLHHWISTLPEEHFREILPLLRRTFAVFDRPLRVRFTDMALNTGKNPSGYQDSPITRERAQKVLPILKKLIIRS